MTDTITLPLEVAMQALEALWDSTSKLESQLFRNPVVLPDNYKATVCNGFVAHKLLSAAIEAAKCVEPVAWWNPNGRNEETSFSFSKEVGLEPLYTAPPADARDAARIDWLERQDYDELSFALFQDQPNDGKRGVSVGSGWHIGNTLREAIDKAMGE